MSPRGAWVLLVLAACGAHARIRDASRCGAAPAEPPASRDELVVAAAAAERGALDQLVGRFTHGGIPVYAGHLSVHGGRTDATIDGDVVAAMVHFHGELYVVDPRLENYFVVAQQPGTPGVTTASSIYDRFTSGGSPFTCRGCVPDLTAAPPRIELRHVALPADGLRTLVLDGTLARVPPAAVTLDDVRTLLAVTEGTDVHRVLAAIERQGTLWTRQVAGTATVPTDAPGLSTPERPECDRVADYTAEWWIDDACAAHYGVRDVHVLRTATRCCAHHEISPYPCSGPPPIDCVDE